MTSVLKVNSAFTRNLSFQCAQQALRGLLPFFRCKSVLFNMTRKLNPFTLNNCLIVNDSSVHIIPKKNMFAFLIFHQNVTTCSTLTVFPIWLTSFSGWTMLTSSQIIKPSPDLDFLLGIYPISLGNTLHYESKLVAYNVSCWLWRQNQDGSHLLAW